MRRRTLLAVLAAVGAGAHTAAAASAPDQLTLRLADLGPGYHRSLSGAACKTLHIDTIARQDPLRGLSRLPHRGCRIGFASLWTPAGQAAGPAEVVSAALAFRDVAGSREALIHASELAAYALAPTSVAVLQPDRRALRTVRVLAPAIGDEAVLLRTAAGAHAISPLPAVVVAWRSGSVLGLVAVSTNGEDAEQAALRLAETQEARIVAPTPLLRSDDADLEVVLDDPQLGVPVRWLGRRVAAQGHLPALRLFDSFPPSAPERQAGVRAVLSYGRRFPDAYIELRTPRRLRRTDMRLHRRTRCLRSASLALRDGRATVSWQTKDCGTHEISPFAVVREPGVTVVVRTESGPYATRAGVRRLVRALRARAAPTP